MFTLWRKYASSFFLLGYVFPLHPHIERWPCHNTHIHTLISELSSLFIASIAELFRGVSLVWKNSSNRLSLPLLNQYNFGWMNWSLSMRKYTCFCQSSLFLLCSGLLLSTLTGWQNALEMWPLINQDFNLPIHSKSRIFTHRKKPIPASLLRGCEALNMA